MHESAALGDIILDPSKALARSVWCLHIIQFWMGAIYCIGGIKMSYQSDKSQQGSCQLLQALEHAHVCSLYGVTS